MRAYRRCIEDALTIDGIHATGEAHLPWDDLTGEITFRDEERDDRDVFDGWRKRFEGPAEGGLFLPESCPDFNVRG